MFRGEYFVEVSKFWMNISFSCSTLRGVYFCEVSIRSRMKISLGFSIFSGEYFFEVSNV